MFVSVSLKVVIEYLLYSLYYGNSDGELDWPTDQGPCDLYFLS